MIINHHPPEDLLFAYSAGDLVEAWSLMIATHVSLCTSCRHQMYEAEAIGGSLMENIIPEILEQDTYEKTLAIVQNEEVHALPGPSSSYCAIDGSCGRHLIEETAHHTESPGRALHGLRKMKNVSQGLSELAQ